MARRRYNRSVRYRPTKPWQRLGLLVGTAALGLGLWGIISYYNVKHGGVPPAAVTATSSPDKPSEEPVPDKYSVPADQPKQITLPTINAKGFIQPVGVDQSNQMVAPGNIHLAGWYTGGAKPGQPGLSIIDGHVSGIYDQAVFYSLKNLKPGDKFTVTYGDDSVRHFKVASLKTVPADQATEALFERDQSIKNQLNLITCGGKYVPSSKTYEDRVVVMAENIAL